METSLRKTIYQDDDVHFEVEEMGDWLVLHCNVQHWSVSKYKKMIQVFARFSEYAKEQGYKGFISGSPNPKFCNLFGGRTEIGMDYENGYVEVMKWDLTQSVSA